MTRSRTLVDPRMHASNEHLFPHRIDIQRAAKLRGASGGVSEPFADESGLRDLSCRVAVKQSAGPGEIRAPGGTYVEWTHRIVLNEYRLDILATDRVQWGALILGIVRVEQDSTTANTALVCQEVR